MKYQLPSKRVLVGLAIIAPLMIVLIIVLQRSRNVILIHDDQVDLQKFNNSVASFIIKNGYGYRVNLVESTIKEVREHLLDGEVDISLELWRENNLLWLRKALAEKQVVDYGELYGGGKQYWIVSKWYAEEKGIETVSDMEKHWKDFLDPDDPSKGLFFNCIYGWTCRDINRVKFQAYGLDRFYNTVSPVSPNSLKSIYENSSKRRQPVFGYYWEPNSVIEKQDWHVLTEPSYSEDVWIKVVEAAMSGHAVDLEKACSYKNTGAHKIAGVNLQRKAPDVAEMFAKMKIDMKVLGATESGRRLLEAKGDPIMLAKNYLQNYREQWHKWVPDEVRERVELAINDQE